MFMLCMEKKKYIITSLLGFLDSWILSLFFLSCLFSDIRTPFPLLLLLREFFYVSIYPGMYIHTVSVSSLSSGVRDRKREAGREIGGREGENRSEVKRET